MPNLSLLTKNCLQVRVSRSLTKTSTHLSSPRYISLILILCGFCALFCFVSAIAVLRSFQDNEADNGKKKGPHFDCISFLRLSIGGRPIDPNFLPGRQIRFTSSSNISLLLLRLSFLIESSCFVVGLLLWTDLRFDLKFSNPGMVDMFVSVNVLH